MTFKTNKLALSREPILLFSIYVRKLFANLILTAILIVGVNAPAFAQQKAPTLEVLLQINSVKKLNVRERAIYYANVFLNNKTPYIANPLGEGPTGEISKEPLYRFDGFDCTTFVETVMGLAFSATPEQFKQKINQIRYENAKVDYEARNHFTSVDWIPNNTAQGFVKDITIAIAGHDSRWSQTWIDKAGWLSKKGDNYVEMARHYDRELANLPYIAKEDLINKEGIQDRIPSGSIFNLVRPNWDVVKAAGTRMDVSHQGFLIRENGVLYMVHASNGMGRDGSDNYMGVKKETLTNYITRVMLSKDSMAGFNILALPNREVN